MTTAEQEARDLLGEILDELGRLGFDDLLQFRKVHAVDRTGRAGTPFVTETEAFFDDLEKSVLRVRVSVSSATGKRKDYVEVWDEILVPRSQGED